MPVARSELVPQGETLPSLPGAEGSREAASELYEVLSGELRRRASAQMKGQSLGHTLQVTALVNEAWLRLVGRETHYTDREHFLAAASRAMRSVLVDHARRRRRMKRGGQMPRFPLDEALDLFEVSVDLPELDRALANLAEVRERQAKVVELRFFGGLTIEDTAKVLGVSAVTVERDWSLARIWLRRELGRLALRVG